MRCSGYDKKFLINADSEFHFPEQTKPLFLEHNLQFYVSKVLDCPDKFDEGCIIFKFESLEFPRIVRYSGNYFGEYAKRLIKQPLSN